MDMKEHEYWEKVERYREMKVKVEEMCSFIGRMKVRYPVRSYTIFKKNDGTIEWKYDPETEAFYKKCDDLAKEVTQAIVEIYSFNPLHRIIKQGELRMENIIFRNESGVNSCYWNYRGKCTNEKVIGIKTPKGFSRVWGSSQSCTYTQEGRCLCSEFIEKNQWLEKCKQRKDPTPSYKYEWKAILQNTK